MEEIDSNENRTRGDREENEAALLQKKRIHREHLDISTEIIRNQLFFQKHRFSPNRQT